ncbi:quaternary amine ABC transporter ATP-binding protein [Reinekea marinisedimentorum]|uniref:Quaternary amine transport ATP-binding protein n=1 Tax=Reinekea marinisedimentorum TaxID=230495 RepID=A0A4R3IBM8_9GAMM|nr:glycine betaine/L-proline ABC transporter ATP-binding protein [Reinekea marinisedimentorum]TCS41908.1 glycine betaine/proline transport system ATP-binding protein [Reinekea marinisedimentorum]
MTDSLIKIEGLYKLFGRTPAKHMGLVKQGLSKDEILKKTGHTLGLKDINLDIKRSEIYVIMGLSGSGKSTLIRHFNRLIDPTEGKVVVEGQDIMTLNDAELREFRRKKMSMVFQRFGLLPHKTVVENVAFGLKVRGIGKEERQQKATQWLADVGLKGYEDQYPSQLSGGQQQRVGLARALCTDAEILLMDEAFSALDPLIRSEMQDQLIELQEKLHKTIIFITHDLDEALRIGDRIAILRDGELIQVGAPADILLHPADDYVEKFVRDVNRARALSVDTVMKPAKFRISAETVGEALKEMRTSKHEYAYNVTGDGYQGALALDQLEELDKSEYGELLTDEHYYDSDVNVEPDAVIEEVIPETLDQEYPIPVVDEEGKLQGELSRDTIAEVLSPQPEAGEGEETEKTG